MNQQCGNCKWWDIKLLRMNSYGVNVAPCVVKLPSSLIDTMRDDMSDNDGKYCPVYEECKE